MTKDQPPSHSFLCCHTCGATQDGKGRPLTSRTNYCSPYCRDRAESRQFKTEHGGSVLSAPNSDGEYYKR